MQLLSHLASSGGNSNTSFGSPYGGKDGGKGGKGKGIKGGNPENRGFSEHGITAYSRGKDGGGHKGKGSKGSLGIGKGAGKGGKTAGGENQQELLQVLANFKGGLPGAGQSSGNWGGKGFSGNGNDFMMGNSVAGKGFSGMGGRGFGPMSAMGKGGSSGAGVMGGKSGAKGSPASKGAGKATNVPWNYKTKPCMHYRNSGKCGHGNNCAYYHDESERRLPNLAQKPDGADTASNYKTKPCNQYHRFGTCRNGDSCAFYHEDSDRTLPGSSGGDHEQPSSWSGEPDDATPQDAPSAEGGGADWMAQLTTLLNKQS